MDKLYGYHKYKPQDLDVLIEGTSPGSTHWLIYTQFQDTMRENERLKKCITQLQDAQKMQSYAPNRNKESDNG